MLTGVSVAKQPCFERVVFSFKEGFPASGYKVSYEPGPFQAKSNGERIPVEGRVFLVVRMEPGKGEGAYDLDGQGKIASDPIEPPEGRAKIFQVRGLGGYGGAVVWVIGMDTRRAFRAGRQANPPQLVIDV
ncbi:MAG: AMIN-like domain-containing (lipo)protein [Acidimicrobiia bacterium]